jgi:hypothetical protein
MQRVNAGKAPALGGGGFAAVPPTAAALISDAAGIPVMTARWRPSMTVPPARLRRLAPLAHAGSGFAEMVECRRRPYLDALRRFRRLLQANRDGLCVAS